MVEVSDHRLRRTPARKVDLDRAIKAVTDAGLHVAGVRVGNDGSIEVLTGEARRAQPDDLEAWRAARAARKAQGA
jgi:hypothetical protein